MLPAGFVESWLWTCSSSHFLLFELNHDLVCAQVPNQPNRQQPSTISGAQEF